MSSREDFPEDKLVSSIVARMKEISDVKYIKSEDNLTDEQREHASQMDYRAAVERDNRLSGGPVKGAGWPEAAPRHWIYPWAMQAQSDVYFDLLETMEAHGAANRPRLPGVTLAHLERRERFVNEVLAERLEAVRAQETERGRAR